MASSMVVTPVDLREEMDATAPTPTKTAEGKARFLIRTLPRDCNPTPTPASGPATAPLLSPKPRKISFAEATVELVEPENPFDDINEEKLQKLTGKTDLSRVTSLQLSVDSTKQSVEAIGELLPSLQQLRLTPHSTLHSFRDLGTSLHSLQNLSVPHCGMKELDGIGALTALQELYLQHNEISDISPLTMHDELHVVDLEGNLIADVGQIEQLAFCPQLASLTLRGNPLCRIANYRRIVANFLPQLNQLDGVAITNAEREQLEDDEIDAAILAFKQQLAREEEQAKKERECIARPESSHGRRQDGGSSTLARAPSTARLGMNGLEPATPEAAQDDYGSSLTHGSDVVFAGNVTSALRRHRSETEGGDTTVFPGDNNRAPAMERPSTPARESITATLNRANELERHKSRDAILHELRDWQLETAGASIVGIVAIEDPSDVISPSVSPTKRPPSSSGRATTPAGQRSRPSTASTEPTTRGVREAFVDSTKASDKSIVKRRSSSSLSSASAAVVPTSSARNVDILILNEDSQHRDDDQQPCSPRKTSRGVFTTATRSGGDWNLEEIAPKLDLECTESFLQRSSRRGATPGDDDGDSTSSGSDTEDMRRVARQLKQRKVAAKPPKHSKPKGFFNVAESLHAIDRWREQMEDEHAPASHPPAQSEPVKSRVEENARGLACRTSDDQIVRWIKEKHANVAEIKTRDGFRRFFRGIEEARLAAILSRMFSDAEKVRRRLQLMQGLYSGQISS